MVVPESLIVLLFIELLLLTAPLLFIAADLWAGLRKARQRGEPITSNGWKRTVSKIARYYNMLFALGVIDTLQVAALWYLDTFARYSLPLFPLFTFLGTLFVGLIETKSIMEPADMKEKREASDIMALAAAIARHKTEPEEIAAAVARYLTEKNA